MKTTEVYVFMQQQVYIPVEYTLFILCLLVLFSPWTIAVPEQKGTSCPTGAVVLSSWIWFVVACQLFLWKLLFTRAAGFMVLLTSLFKSALICSSASRFSSKEFFMGGGYAFSGSCTELCCWLILPSSIFLNQIIFVSFSFLTYLSK